MAKITSQVNIEYMATGLESIVKILQAMDPASLTDKAKKSQQEMITSSKTLLDQIKAAIAKGDISEELAKTYKEMFHKVLGKDFKNQISNILKGVGGDFDAAFGGMIQEAQKLNEEIAKIESDITLERKGFKGEGKNLDFANKSQKEQAAQKVLNELKLKEANIDKDNLTRAKGKKPTYENLVLVQERANKASADMTKTQREQIQLAIQKGELDETNRAHFEALAQKMEGNLKAEEVFARLKAKSLVDSKLEVQLEDKKTKLKDLEKDKVKKINQLKAAQEPLQVAKEEAELQKQINAQKQTYTQNQQLVLQLMDTVTKLLEHSRKEEEKREKIIRAQNEAIKQGTNAISKQGNTFGKAANQVFNYGLAFTLLRRVYRETLRTIRDLDKALTEMAIVTTMSREQTFQLADTMSELASQTGFTTTEIARLSTVFFRQGRALSEVIELTTVAAKAARIAGIDAVASANFLTSAINAFGMSADQALEVSDRFAAIAAQSASSYEELAIGLSKFAAQANVAGVSIDFAMGLLAKGVETTREAPETIGTALKTVIARMRELTDLGKTFEDGMDISRVETALRQVGIALRDEQGQFRDLEKVLTEIGMAWNTYDRNQQASIAVSLAGTRQQSRLIAIMQDFDRTLELVNISQESAGATNAQQVEFMQSLQAATIQLQTAWQDFIRTIGETETIISIVRGLTFVIESLTEGLKLVGLSGSTATIALVALVAVLKFGKPIKNIWIKLTAANTAATVAETAATKQATAWTWKWVAAKIALLAPILLIIAAVGLLTAGAIKLAGSQERATKKLQEAANKVEAMNFEMSRASRNINNLIQNIEKLESLRYMTPEQEQELESLRERLLELIDKDVAENFKKGLISWDQVLNSILETEGRNLARRIHATEELIGDAVNSFVGLGVIYKDIVDEDGEIMGSRPVSQEVLIRPPSKQELTILKNSFLNLYSTTFGDIGEDLQGILSDFFDTVEFSPEEFALMATDSDKFIRENLQPIVLSYEDFVNSVDLEAEKFSDVIHSFNKSFQTLNDDDILKDLIVKAFPEYAAFSEMLKENTEEATNFIKTLEKLNLTSTKDIQTGFKLFGKNFEAVSEQILEFANNLTHLDSDQAIRFAFARASQATEDLEARAWLLNQAFEQTTIDIVQNIDRIQSRIQRVSEVQQQWIEGTLSAQDLLQFFDQNADIFNTLEDIDNFLLGGSMTGKTFNTMLQAQKDIVTELEFQWQLYHSTQDEITKSAALQQIAILGALSSARGELVSLTGEQYSYNAALRAYNNLASIGIDTTQILSVINQNMGTAMAQTTTSTQRHLASIQESFAENAKNIDNLSENILDYFDVVGNQLVPNMEKISELGEDALMLLETASSAFQETLNQGLEDFLNAREESLKIEKDLLDKQQKVYENYFSEIDKLESKRERQKSREDLVSQLSRLEGATDERSRRRALEIRQELNDLDTQQAQDAQTEAREALLRGFEEQYIKLEEKWSSAAEVFVTKLSNSGTASGNAFVTAVNSAGLFSDAEMTGEKIGNNISSSIITRLGERFGFEGFEEFQDINIIDTDTDTDTEVFEPTDADRARRAAFVDEQFNLLQANRRWGTRRRNSDRDRETAEQRARDIFGFAKGGMVDFEGLAMLHGSRSAPEAVLSPAQTEMFVGLRDALQGLSFNSMGSGSVNIENISISTASLNNNQDFKRAGESLADAFKHAIQRKGVTINTNRT